jgi:hypothetical protein
MTAETFKALFSTQTEERKILICAWLILNMPISRSSFYRKMKACSWDNAELLFINVNIKLIGGELTLSEHNK